jgi:hypothetical protein
VPGLELGLLAGRVDGGINLKGEYMSALVGKFYETNEDMIEREKRHRR